MGTKGFTIVSTIFAVAALTGCGNIAEQAIETAAEQAASADGEDIEFDFDLEEGRIEATNADGEEVVIDLESEDGGSATIETEDGVAEYGSDLGRPDWLDDDIMLPPGLNVANSWNDETNGDKAVAGVITDGNTAEIVAEQLDMLAAAGFTPVEGFADPTRSLIARHDDGRAIQLNIIDAQSLTSYSLVVFGPNSPNQPRV